MSAPLDVLERNLERLLRRAYIPVEPREEFRLRLAELVRATVGARARRASPASMGRRRALLVLAAAALVFALARVLPDAGGEGLAPEDIAAQGCVAVRDAPDGRWRALCEPATALALVSDWLEVVTPSSAEQRIEVAQGASVLAHASTRLALEGGERLSLSLGGMTVARGAHGPRWRIETAAGLVDVARGEVRLAYEGARSVRVALVWGEARLLVGARERVLAPGDDVLLPDEIDDVAGEPEPSAVEGSAAPGREQVTSEPAPAVPEPERPSGAALAGRVLDASGAPQPRFTLSLLRHEGVGRYPEAEHSAVDDADGRFALGGLRPGSYTVFVDADEHAVRRVGPLELAAGETRELDLRLERGQLVRGFVRNAASGAPIAGALVLSERDAPTHVLRGALQRAPEGIRAATSGADGYFELTDVARGAQNLRASASGFAPAWSERFELSAPGADVELALGPGGALAGRVTRPSGEPWPSVAVVASLVDFDGQRTLQTVEVALTDAGGRYRLEHLAPGYYVALLVEARGARPVRVTQTALEHGVETRLDFLLGDTVGARVRGRVLDAAGEPVAGATITAVRQGNEVSMVDARWDGTTTSNDGGFELGNLPSGTYGLVVGDAMELYHAQAEPVVVGAGAIVERDVRLGRARLAGTIVDGRSRAPVQAVVVLMTLDPRGVAESMMAKVATRADGGFSIPWLPAGRYRPYAYPLAGRFGHAAGDEVQLGELEERLDYDVALWPGGELGVLVLDRAGRPVARAAVQLAGEDVDGADGFFLADPFTNEHGRLRIAGIRPGRWRVDASTPELGAATSSLTVLADETHEIVLALDATRAVDER